MARFPKDGGGLEAIVHAALMRGIKFGFYGIRLFAYVIVAIARSATRRS